MIREFFEAINRGDIGFVKQYLNDGWPLDVKDESGSPPLHEAVYQGEDLIVQLLLEKKASVNEKDAFGNTPLQLAATRGPLETVQLLLKYGAHIDAISEQRTWTPFMLALNSRQEQLAEYLLMKGADVQFQEEQEGWTPLLIACEQHLTHFVKEIVKHGADVNKNLTAGDAKGRNALVLISYHGDSSLATFLLDHGVNINHQPNNQGLTALHWAVYNGHVDLARLLLTKGADPNIPALGTYQGRTPLHYAASAGRPDLVEALLSFGGDPLQPDEEQRSPLQLASEHKVNTRNREAYEKSVKLLQKR